MTQGVPDLRGSDRGLSLARGAPGLEPRSRRGGEVAAILRQEGPCPSRTCQHIDVGDDRRTATYDAVSERLGADGDPPPGLIVHTVGFAGNVFRIFDVWETDADRVRFDEERLGPILAEVMGDDGPRGQSQSYTYELHDVIAP